MRSNKELINALRGAPAPWMDVAIVVAFDNRFEFIAEDHANPMYRLNALQEQGGLAIGLAGVKSSERADRAFRAEIFQEYEGQAWAHRYMDTLRGIVRATFLFEVIKMPDTGQRREITRFVDSKEAETVQEAKKLVAKTKQGSAKTSKENRSRKRRK